MICYQDEKTHDKCSLSPDELKEKIAELELQYYGRRLTEEFVKSKKIERKDMIYDVKQGKYVELESTQYYKDLMERYANEDVNQMNGM